MARLLVIKGADEGKQFELNDSHVGIGRDAANIIRLHDTEVSRRHAECRKVDGGYSLVDVGSANGTFVNNQRIRGQSLLHSGDQIRVGTVLFVVDLGDEIEAPWKGGADAGNTTIKVKDMHLGDKPSQGFDTL